MTSKFIALYTTQKTQKNKRWKDAFAEYNSTSKKFKLFDSDAPTKSIAEQIIKTIPQLDETVELEKFLVLIDSFNVENTTSVQQQVNPPPQTKQSNVVALKKSKPLTKTNILPILSKPKKPLLKKKQPRRSIEQIISMLEEPNGKSTQQTTQSKQVNNPSKVSESQKKMDEYCLEDIINVPKSPNFPSGKIESPLTSQKKDQSHPTGNKLHNNNPLLKKLHYHISESKDNTPEKEVQDSLEDFDLFFDNEPTAAPVKTSPKLIKNQKTTKKLLNTTTGTTNLAVKRKRLKLAKFKPPKAMETASFPLSLQDTERVIEQFKQSLNFCKETYKSLSDYITDMNNIVVNEMNYQFATLAQSFYTLIDTYATGMGAKGRIKICPHGVASRQISRKEGPNKGRPFYSCPENKCKAFQWDDSTVDYKKMRYDLPRAIDRTIDLNEIDVKFFESQGVVIFTEVQIFQSKKKEPAPVITDGLGDGIDDALTTTTTYFMKFTNPRKVKEIKKDDLWVLLPTQYPYKSSSQFHIITSLYHAPTSDGLMAIEFVTRIPSNFKSFKCLALHASNASTDLLMLETLTKISHETPFSISPLLKYIIFQEYNPKPPEPLANLDILQLYQLNQPQKEVILNVVSSLSSSRQPLTLVHGVFGAGKSHLLSVLCILLASMNLRVLVCASTNVAVDRVLENLENKQFTSFYRVGSLKKISKRILPYVLTESTGLNELRDIKKDKMLTSTERAIIEREIKQRKSGNLTKRKELLQSALVVGVTCASSTNPLLGTSYDVVLFDEATQTIEPLALIPIFKFQPKVMVCVGDPMQLDPVLRAEHHSATLFQRMCPTEQPIMLNVQYRCNPQISAIANRMFYDGKLIDGDNVKERTSIIPGAKEIIICYHETEDETTVDGSYTSNFEVMIVNEWIRLLEEKKLNLSEVGVMSFYRQQCISIAHTIKQKLVSIATIDAFQGAEKDIVILSFVRHKESSFLESAKRLNVAVTRAKNNIVLVIHKNLLGHSFMEKLLEGANVSYVDCDVLMHTKRLIFED
ncbi:hypothetical protein QTN25_006854 [Entamoeba marina]